MNKNFFIAICIFAFYTLSAKGQINELPRSTPEAEGISSSSIMTFIDSITTQKDVHSFMILRHGKVISEGWWAPYAPELKHSLYSLSKTFTATAIGFAVEEGLLSVEDRVVNFFPENLPDTISPNLAKLSIKHLLTMSCGQEDDPVGIITARDNDWVTDFLRTPIVHEPGSVFLYNSTATFILSAVIQKVTGMTTLDYLKPRLFEPLNITDVDWEKNPVGISVGGWGLRLQTESMSKMGQLFLQKGKWNGKQIISEAWINEASTKKIENGKQDGDWAMGYCYQMWRCRNNAFRMDGAYGQYVVMMPDQDMVIVMTSYIHNMGKQLEHVWNILLPAAQNQALPTDVAANSKLKIRTANLKVASPAKVKESPLAKQINDKTYTFPTNNRNIQSIKLNFDNNECMLDLRMNNQSYLLPFSNGKWHLGDTSKPQVSLIPSPRVFDGYLFRIAGAYSWENNNTLKMHLRYIDAIHDDVFTCRFNGDEITLEITENLPPAGFEKTLQGNCVKPDLVK